MFQEHTIYVRNSLSDDLSLINLQRLLGVFLTRYKISGILWTRFHHF